MAGPALNIGQCQGDLCVGQKGTDGTSDIHGTSV